MRWGRTFRRERRCNNKHEDMINCDVALLLLKATPEEFLSFNIKMRYMRLRLRFLHPRDLTNTVLPPIAVGSINVLLSV